LYGFGERYTTALLMSDCFSAADLYIKDYIDPYVSAGDHPEAVPLRIVYRHRWTQTIHPTVLKYCLLNTDSAVPGGFRVPRLDEVFNFRLVVATLSTSIQLFDIGINKGLLCGLFFHAGCLF